MAPKMKGRGRKAGKKGKARKNREVSYVKFFRALCDGKLAVIKAQLQNGADVNREFKAEVDSIRQTPLYVAAEYGRIKVVKVLLAAGADVNKAMENGGFVPLYAAAHKGHTAVATALLDAGADVNKATNDGCTPLYLAAEFGHTAVVTVLLDTGAAANKAQKDGVTPLFVAAQQGHTAVVAALLDAGADLNKAMNTGSTPLFIAAQCGYTAVVTALLDAGAEINKANKNGITPLAIAASRTKTEAANLLLRAGADIDVAIAAGEKYNDTAVIELITTLQAKIEEDAIAQAPEINQMVVHIRRCGYCESEGDGLLKCAGCGTVAYCGTRCQRKAWKGGHKVLCRRIQRERAEAERTANAMTEGEESEAPEGDKEED